MSYRLIDSNAIAEEYEWVNDMPCIYADLPNGLDGNYYGKLIINSEKFSVVRCGECKWWMCANNTEIIKYGNCTHPYSAIKENCLPGETWYCANGERREE